MIVGECLVVTICYEPLYLRIVLHRDLSGREDACSVEQVSAPFDDICASIICVSDTTKVQFVTLAGQIPLLTRDKANQFVIKLKQAQHSASCSRSRTVIYTTKSLGRANNSSLRFRNMDELIREEFRKRHCNKDGVQQGPLKVTNFYEHMYKSYPKHRKALKIPLRRWLILTFKLEQRLTLFSFIKERSYTYCDSFPRDEQGIFLDSESAFAHLKAMRPDLDNGGAIRLWDE